MRSQSNTNRRQSHTINDDKRKYSLNTAKIRQLRLKLYTRFELGDNAGRFLDDGPDQAIGVSFEAGVEGREEDGLLNGGGDCYADDLADRTEEVAGGDGDRHLVWLRSSAVDVHPEKLYTPRRWQ